ncbi:MAG: MMPL family transporter, partial [Candidatus Brocadiales bacterium]|nr:MMPL family transporter [Candidatus Brocadiales bacterium]
MQVAYYLWLCSLTALSIFILTFFPQRAQYIETGLLRLLPDNNQVLVVNHAWKAFSDNIDKKVIFLVGNSDPDLTIRAGESLYKGLKASEYFNDVHFRIDINQQIQTFSTYSKHHRGLLSNEDRKRLQMGNEQIILDNALKMMYSPITYNVNHLIHIDPFFLLPNYLNSIKKYAGSPGEGGEVLFYDNDIIYTQIMASINGDHYSLENQIHLFNALQKITDKVEHDNPGIQVLKTGSIFYAHAASTEARAEVSFIGLGSLLGIILLVSMVFRSLAPLLLSLLSITFGILLSIAVTLFFFPRIHLFTLVFGANLIGVSVDYAFHYFTASADDNTSLHPIKRILPGITFGVLTSVIAYAALGIAPFPGLHQLALFSSVGLIGAYITVIVLFPKIPALNGLKLHQLWLSKLSGFILNAWNNLQGLRLMAVLILFALFIYYGLSNLKIEDDVRLLHSEFKDLKIQEEKIRNIIDQSYSNQLMIVQAESNEELQKRE